MSNLQLEILGQRLHTPTFLSLLKHLISSYSEHFPWHILHSLNLVQVIGLLKGFLGFNFLLFLISLATVEISLLIFLAISVLDN